MTEHIQTQKPTSFYNILLKISLYKGFMYYSNNYIILQINGNFIGFLIKKYFWVCFLATFVYYIIHINANLEIVILFLCLSMRLNRSFAKIFNNMVNFANETIFEGLILQQHSIVCQIAEFISSQSHLCLYQFHN